MPTLAKSWAVLLQAKAACDFACTKVSSLDVSAIIAIFKYETLLLCHLFIFYLNNGVRPVPERGDDKAVPRPHAGNNRHAAQSPRPSLLPVKRAHKAFSLFDTSFRSHGHQRAYTNDGIGLGLSLPSYGAL
ncbi:hypothetical protein EVAR_61553_1 [Eumeta japonica]|uniref:Uncharacterized protein n=1 Tax=Eumeta variegata TaxID=151549 RepID=A0A4C1Z6V6_EUMVA|nr:hypothetical protein EVAR_61553_1 [Eumeta japonica]